MDTQNRPTKVRHRGKVKGQRRQFIELAPRNIDDLLLDRFPASTIAGIRNMTVTYLHIQAHGDGVQVNMNVFLSKDGKAAALASRLVQLVARLGTVGGVVALLDLLHRLAS